MNLFAINISVISLPLAEKYPIHQQKRLQIKDAKNIDFFRLQPNDGDSMLAVFDTFLQFLHTAIKNKLICLHKNILKTF